MIRLLQGDVRDVLPTLASDSVHCCVTSPPYWNLRDYGTALWEGGAEGCEHVVTRVSGRDRVQHEEYRPPSSWTNRDATPPHQCKCGARRIDRQLGLEPTPDAYIAAMVAVFREVRRVLRPDGTLWLNVGSSYASGDKRPNRSPASERVPAYDTACTAPSGSPVPDYAYPGQRGESQGDLPTHHGGTAGIDRRPPPTSLLDAMTGRDSEHPASLAALPLLHDVLASTTLSSLPNARASFDLGVPASAAPLGDQTSLGVEHPSADSLVFPSAPHSASGVLQDQPWRKRGIEATGGASASRTAGKGAGLVSCDCGSCGICFAYSAIPMLQFKAKDLMLMPELLALALQADGWWLRSDIIWAKPNPMPESCTDRPTSAHEHVFLLTKRARYFYDCDGVREPQDEPGRIQRHGAGTKRDGARVDAGSFHGNEQSAYNPAGRNLRNVWTIATHAYPAAHFATFPPELAERCIRAGTSERGCCAACGAPWVRMTERSLDNVPTRLATKRAPVDCEAMAAYLRERREALGLSRAAVDAALGTRTLYSWFEGRPAGIEPPTPEQWTKLKDVLALDARFDEQIYGTVEVEITDHSPSKAPGVRTYAKAWNSEATTTGWSPSCAHDADVVPCTVLDPFAGAGTTLLVADRLQRHAIGIDLNTQYAELARSRIEADCPLFTSWAPAEDPEDERIRDLFAEAAE